MAVWVSPLLLITIWNLRPFQERVKDFFQEEADTRFEGFRQIKPLLLQLRKKMGRSVISRMVKRLHLPQHFFYFFPLPRGQGSFRPTFEPCFFP